MGVRGGTGIGRSEAIAGGEAGDGGALEVLLSCTWRARSAPWHWQRCGVWAARGRALSWCFVQRRPLAPLTRHDNHPPQAQCPSPAVCRHHAPQSVRDFRMGNGPQCPT